MNELNRTSPLLAPDSPSPPPGARAAVVLNADGIDTRRYCALTADQKIEWLEANGRRLHEYYVAMTAALASLRAEQTREVKQ